MAAKTHVGFCGTMRNYGTFTAKAQGASRTTTLALLGCGSVFLPLLVYARQCLTLTTTAFFPLNNPQTHAPACRSGLGQPFSQRGARTLRRIVGSVGWTPTWGYSGRHRSASRLHPSPRSFRYPPAHTSVGQAIYVFRTVVQYARLLITITRLIGRWISAYGWFWARKLLRGTSESPADNQHPHNRLHMNDHPGTPGRRAGGATTIKQGRYPAHEVLSGIPVQVS